MGIGQREREPLVALMEINPITMMWAEQQYSQFSLPHLGEKRRHTHLMSRALLLSVLQRYYNSQLTELPELGYNQHKKPYFISAPYLFNLTHTEDAVAVIILPLSSKVDFSGNPLQREGLTDQAAPANKHIEQTIAADSAIGIDLEKIQPRKNFSALLRRTFSPLERAWILEQSRQSIDQLPYNIASLPRAFTKSQQRRFFLLWSTKEAYLKADGRGLQGLKSLEIDPQEYALYGDLKGGRLYAGTASFNNNAHSFALYLPKTIADHLKITTLKVDAHKATLSSRTIKWDLTLSDMPKQHNNKL